MAIKKVILHLVILTIGISCINGVKGNKENFIAEKPETKEIIQIQENIRFNFSVTIIKTFKETIKVKATLYNNSSDTVYFLTTSCDGEQYSLRYDTVKFDLTPLALCNASYPEIKSIPPKGHHDFETHLKYKTSENKIKLGFDFYQVDKRFDLTKKNLANLTIFNRPVNQQTIIWADEKTIQ